MNSKQFGPRQPPLSRTIKGILERYPDGQIFKEMIQNADDAGAKTVLFYVDERHHGSANLPLLSLAKFQGPALVAANDACFTEDDWEGIQSLQQSIKADDPFKVGKFGIGFNSVYHLTDLPIIVSGNRLACSEPLKEIWKGESGQSFTLTNLISQKSDIVAPLAGLANFNATTLSYPHTLFRLPLRTQPSGLSDNVYTITKLQELLDALRVEAKFLLLFLKSVNKIEVIHVSRLGEQNLSFCVEISTANKQAVVTRRESFMQQLHTAHCRQPYRISNIISYTASFTVVVEDQNPRHNQSGTSEWLVANHVGSDDPSVQAAAEEQKIFPWVGAALELSNLFGGGRIFCFLPMPVEASAGLPIHVNGTFGLNDERRSLKWPGIERTNDPTANWNKTLVSKLLPYCYATLLLEAKNYLTAEQFYRAWPNVDVVKHTQFMELMQPLFASLFKDTVVCTERAVSHRQLEEWIHITQAIFISEDNNLASVVCQTLSDCGVKLVKIPSVIWKAIKYNKLAITEVSPQLARTKLRLYPQSYDSINPIDKRELLKYCLSDRYYWDLNGLYLLPLANNTFTDFANFSGTQLVYLCTLDCPRYLLPNLDHILVDIDDEDLYTSLSDVALDKQTKLRMLTESDISQLLPQALPSNWQRSNLVLMPNANLPATWFETFWKWLQDKNLEQFQKQHILPVFQSSQQHRESFYLTRLTVQSAVTLHVVYISRHASCSDLMLSALYKMKVLVCHQSDFNFVQHNQLASYVTQFDTNGVLDSIAHQSTYSSATFTPEEADALRKFIFNNNYTPNQRRIAVLQRLCIFSSASNSLGKLYSYSCMTTQSYAQKALGEPARSLISVANLPPNLILFSSSDYYQLQVLKSLQVTFPTDTRLILDHIFPMIHNRYFPDGLIDGLMTEILDNFQGLWLKDNSLVAFIQSLPFLKIATGVRKCPKDLFDPSDGTVSALYEGEDIFPLPPFNTPHRLQILTYCGLGTSVSPQQVLDIIYSISTNSSSQPQAVSEIKYRRAKAVLDYISTSEFRRLPTVAYKSPYRGKYSFSDALHTLATNRSWLPVMNDHPESYPDKLNWKGNNFDCHFVSLNNTVAVPSTDTVKSLPFLVGTQMYIVTPAVHPTIEDWLTTPTDIIVRHTVAHFKEFIACKDDIYVDETDMLVHEVYKYLNKSSSYARQLYSNMQDWIFIKKDNKFVSPDVVALRYNQSFRQSLEPYIYTLPDTLAQYKILFSPASGVSHSVSQSQIVSVLAMIQEDAKIVHPRSTSEEAWTTVMIILNWLTDNGTKNIPADIEVLIPIESGSEWPQLKEASEVVYTDSDFLKNYFQESEERDSYVFVHEKINPSLTKALGVQPLSEFLDISEDTFEDAGQHEPLTTRLKNILRDYKDGLTIMKELLQNADDAEATEVNICYDARQHEQTTKKLFFSGMAEAHGPALIVHNNKTFSIDDFTNITKLAAATKQSKALKIGKFGLGFCSVYHMTDVPSFISRDRLYIFDPTLSYLNKEIKNHSKPGKKIAFTKKIISRSTCSQLSPYDGLFGFDRSFYEGTMFRFPFRTSASELSGTCYSESTVQDLNESIQESSSSLLLFLQHVKCVTFQQIKQGETSPTILFKVTRDCVPMPLALFSGVEVRRLSSSQTSSGTTSDSVIWLVSQKDEKDRLGEHYTASVACPLKQTGSSSTYEVDPSFQGEIFCFLPLSQKTGLPVHVSSNFAVISNRRGIWMSTSDDPTTHTDPELEVKWNVALMQGVIPTAYHTLIVALKQMKVSGILLNYLFHSLWPQTGKLEHHNPWSVMIPQLYEKISSDKLFFSGYKNQWLHLSDSKFLQAGILSHSTIESFTPSCVLATVEYINLSVVDLPREYHSYFCLEGLMIDEVIFIELFFSHVQFLGDVLTERNEVIRCMLEVYTTDIDDKTERWRILNDYFKHQSCIPCRPDGTVLRDCDKIIDPDAHFADLYDLEDVCFPIKSLTKRNGSYSALKNLGMLCETIPLSMLSERAQTIPELYKLDKTKALKRVRLVLESNSTGESSSGIQNLSSIPFLPVLSRPSGYPISWKGQGQELMCGKELVIAKTKSDYGTSTCTDDINIEVAGSQVAFANEEEDGCGYINQTFVRLLQIRLSPKYKEVIDHFKELIEHFTSQTLTADLVERTDRMCLRIYEFLDEKIDDSLEDNQLDLKPLQKLPCVWTGENFISKELVAKEWNKEGPYLYLVPSSLSFRKKLSKALEIKEDFSLTDVQNALEEMSKDFDDSPVDEPCQEVIKSLVPLLWKFDLGESNIMLPDENYVMHWSNTLTYNDAPFAPTDHQYTYVNRIIPRDLAKKLHVTPVRSKFLDKYLSKQKIHFPGVPFGQHEKLPQRIQTILQDYPCDITILKELLQNADDAKATKMYVILDKRIHGTRSILSDEWVKLQGPALLVWNDSTFTDENLQGIQDIGFGSKRLDTESIGQYGIGFNVVYHLTDCPSFITGGETMCILDPHCIFAPGANKNDPGRKYDNLITEGFWDTFKDMKSAYLQDGLQNCPKEIQGQGSLFRFPLRHTAELVEMSKILPKDTSPRPKPITAQDMFKNLTDWAPQMKKAMFFLNHVTELRFFVIEKNSQVLETINNYRTYVEPSVQLEREELYMKVSNFKNVKGNKSLVIRYPITISDVQHNKGSNREYVFEEKWLIQQGVGDIDNKDQTWMYVKNIKPRHGIAVPLMLPRKTSSLGAKSGKSIEPVNEVIDGQLFCFLPLPVKSRLPVHINGHFRLDSHRRELWHSTDPDREDDKSAWNRNMFEAIASSYANFLENAQSFYISSEPYKTFQTAFDALNRYYNIFPSTYPDALDKQYLSLAEAVYEKLVKHNSSVLAVVHSDSFAAEKRSKKVTVKWYPHKSDVPSKQVYFWEPTSWDEGVPDYEKKHIKPIIESFGMQLTAAPKRLKHHFNKGIKDDYEKLKETKPSIVYMYYKKFIEQARLSESDVCTFPCTLDSTVFKRVEVFKRFTRYLLQPSKTNHQEFEFPDHEPFDIPLLVTADGMLRTFSRDNTVLRSNFSEIFPKSLSRFLHPKLMKVGYSSEYFADSLSCGEIVDSILLVGLPNELKTSQLKNFDQYVSKQKLKSLWECLALDSIFTSHLPNILNDWALVPTIDGQLFSYKHRFIPVYPPQACHTYEGIDLPAPFPDIYAVLTDITIPFIDMDTLLGASPNCPCLHEHTRILENLFHFGKMTKLSDLLDREKLKVILNYLKSIDFRDDSTSLGYVKSLPLFEIIDGTFTFLQGRTVVVWHHNTSTVGYNTWAQKLNVYFLHHRGDWTLLGTPDQLKIDTISAEEIYCEYIFKVFSCFSEEVRYHHLEHIKDTLFFTNKANSKRTNFEHRTYKVNPEQEQVHIRAVAFLKQLKELCCIGKDNKWLTPVQDYCDHTLEEIFYPFERRYRFLPEYFTANTIIWLRWYKFFKELGLKRTISKDEFIELCTETASSHPDPGKACGVLLRHLFSEEAQKAEWYLDISFVREVSNIPFVATRPLPELDWIRESAPSKSVRKVHNLTKLSGAACNCPVMNDCLWTVKPIVDLDQNIVFKDKLGKLADNLHLTTYNPQVSDVIQNMKNICVLGKFNDFKLFDQYPELNKPPNEAKSLMEVMKSHFEFLQSNVLSLSQSDKLVLRELTCIPVYSHSVAEHSRFWEVVLVKPCYVVANCNVTDYHPFLHTLPDELKPELGILQEIGVKTSVEIEHLQLVLQLAYDSSEGQVLVESTRVCVVKAITTLKAKLDRRQDSTSLAETLTPLYLPDNSGKLAVSTTLLYVDASIFTEEIKSQLESNNYPLLHMPIKEYAFYDIHFCPLLPETVRPKGLSKLCNQTVAPESREPILSSEIHTALHKTLEMKSTLLAAILACVKHYSKDQTIPDTLKQSLLEFLSSIKLITVRHLRTAITNKDSEVLIGTVDIKFHMQPEVDSPSNTKQCLYLDSTLDKPVGLDLVLTLLSEKILNIIKEEMTNTDELTCSFLMSHFQSLLRLQTPNQVRELMHAKSIAIETETMDDVIFELGNEVPACWHHRLDQSYENVFNSEEIVGYEDREDHIILAQIVYPVLPEGVDGLESVPRTTMRYKIFISPEDVEGIEVSVLRLYKFLRGLKKERVINEEEKDLVPYEGETEPVLLQQKLHREDIKEYKSKLLKQLDEVWKLPPDEKNRALRRLYLKWHPDKNPNNPDVAEEVFKFLNSEIDRRKSERIYRNDLNRTASRQRDSYYREWYNTFPTGGGSRFRGRGRGAEASGVPPFPEEDLQPPKKPEEGKRWVKQAEANFRSLVLLHSGSHNDPKVCADVCFMAHQVAEKALKGGKYFICGLGDKGLMSHNILTHACGLQAERPRETHRLVAHTAPLEVYYLDPRYPNRWPSPTVPADQYTYQQADEAKSHAEAILKIIKDIVVE